MRLATHAVNGRPSNDRRHPFTIVPPLGWSTCPDRCRITHNDFSLTSATLAIATFAFWTVVLGWVVYLSPRARRVVEGTSRVLVRNGAWSRQICAATR